NVAPMVTGLMEFSSHSVTEGHDGGGALGVSGASNRKDSTPDVAGDCCAAGFQSGLCRRWVKTGSALVEHKISASRPKPDICALRLRLKLLSESKNPDCPKICYCFAR